MSISSHFRYRTALVTGASSGIGAEFARALAERGTDLVLVARSGTRLERMAQDLGAEHGVAVHAITRDLTQPGAVAAVHAETDRLGLSVDLLINSAGFGTAAPFDEIETERVDREITLNVGALVGLTRAYLPHMVASGRGGVANVASMAAFGPAPFMAVYAASKAFVLSFTEALWSETRDRGIHVLVLCPGPVESRFEEVAGIPPILGHQRTPPEIVQPALRALERGRPISVVGTGNRALASVIGLLPRRAVLAIARRTMLRALSTGSAMTAKAAHSASDR